MLQYSNSLIERTYFSTVYRFDVFPNSLSPYLLHRFVLLIYPALSRSFSARFTVLSEMLRSAAILRMDG